MSCSKTPTANSAALTIDHHVMTQVWPLLDLVLLEGVYPSLSKGVGFPLERQKRSLVCNRTCISFPDLKVASQIIPILNHIVFKSEAGLHRQLQDSILLDLTAAIGDFAFSPSRNLQEKALASHALTDQLEKVPISKSYQVLTVLIKASAPQWLRNGLAPHLSLLPLRPGGVRHTIEFLSSYYAMPLPESGQALSEAYQRRLISPEGLAQATKVLTSVPSTLTEKEYYTKVAPQLLSLLDGESGPELSAAIASIITSNILNKRSTGAPGAIGWELLAAPQLMALQPASSFCATQKSDVASETLVPQRQLEQSVNRLLALTTSTMNASLCGRLLRPVLLPLWALATFDAPFNVAKSATVTARQLLEIFLSRCGNINHLKIIRDNLLWDGESHWSYGPGESGAIAIRSRISKDMQPDIIGIVSQTERRIKVFLSMLVHSEMDIEVIGEFFRQCLRVLLHIPDSKPQNSSKALLQSEKDPLEDLLTLQLVQALLSEYGEKLATKPHQMLSLIDQFLMECVEQLKQVEARRKTSSNVSLQNISDITRLSGASLQAEDTAVSEDIVATSISLLTALITAKDFVPEDDVRSTLQSVSTHLTFIRAARNIGLSSSVIRFIQDAIVSIEHVTPNDHSTTHPALPSDSAQTAFALAETFANDPPPIQARTLHALAGTIDQAGIPLDIPGITSIIIDQICSNPDTYVHPYLNSALARLAVRRSPGYPTRALVAAFQDANEKTSLDGRLRLGEALNVLIDELAATDLPEDMSKEVSKMMLSIAAACSAVAGRRGVRTLEQKERDKAQRKAKVDQRRAEKAWGGEVPNLADLQAEDEDDRDDMTREKEVRDNLAIQRIIQGWQGAGKTEDVRIRTTALSILGTIMEKAGSSLSSELVTSVVDLSLAILSVEAGEETSLLRRAVMKLFNAHVKALFTAQDTQSDVPSIDGIKWLEVQSSLRLATQIDTDELVRNDASAVLQSLEELRMLQLVNQSTRSNVDANTLQLNKLHGIDVNLEDTLTNQRPRIDILD